MGNFAVLLYCIFSQFCGFHWHSRPLYTRNPEWAENNNIDLSVNVFTLTSVCGNCFKSFKRNPEWAENNNIDLSVNVFTITSVCGKLFQIIQKIQIDSHSFQILWKKILTGWYTLSGTTLQCYPLAYCFISLWVLLALKTFKSIHILFKYFREK